MSQTKIWVFFPVVVSKLWGWLYLNHYGFLGVFVLGGTIVQMSFSCEQQQPHLCEEINSC